MYTFRFWQELGWAILVAILTTLAIALQTFDPAMITDWRAWAIGLTAGAVRAIAGVVLSKLGPSA